MSNIAETIGAGLTKRFNVTGRFVRLMSSTGPVEITYFINGSEIARTGIIKAGYAEEFDEVFDAFTVKDLSGAANTVEILYRMNSRARYDRSEGNVSVTGGTLNQVSKTVAADAKVWTVNYKTLTAMAANSADQIIAPAANVNGLEITRADLMCITGGGAMALVAKATPPANTMDGTVLAVSFASASNALKIETPLYVPPGLGLYFINNVAEGTVIRSALIKVL